MSQGNSTPRVSRGVPWWLWLIAVLATAMVVLGMLVKQSAPGADEVWKAAVENVRSRDVESLRQNLETYREIGGDVDRATVLDGIVAEGTNRSPKAIAILEPYLEHEDRELQILATRFSGVAHQRDANLTRAEDLYQDYRKLSPDDPLPHLLLMRLYQAAGAVVAAADVAQDVLRLDTLDSSAAQVIPLAFQRIGDLDEAIESYASFLDTDTAVATADPGTLSKYLKCLMAAGRADAAAEFLLKNNQYIDNPYLAVAVLLRNDMIDEAEEVLVETERREEIGGDPRYMGQSIRASLEGIRVKAAQLHRSGDSQQAITVLRQAAASYPRTKDVFEQLARVAADVEDDELAEACRKNIDKLTEIEKRIPEAVQRIGTDLESTDLRIEVAKLHRELWNDDEAESWARAASYVAGSARQELLNLIRSIERPGTMFVPFPTEAAESQQKDESGEEGGSSEAPESQETDRPDESQDAESGSAEE